MQMVGQVVHRQMLGIPILVTTGPNNGMSMVMGLHPMPNLLPGITTTSYLEITGTLRTINGRPTILEAMTITVWLHQTTGALIEKHQTGAPINVETRAVRNFKVTLAGAHEERRRGMIPGKTRKTKLVQS